MNLNPTRCFVSSLQPNLFLFGPFIPVVRSLISIPAGISNMPFLKFLMLTTLGTSIWNTVLIYIGVYDSAKWQMWLARLESYSHIINAILALITLGLTVVFIPLVRIRNKTKQ
ncbi:MULTISPECIES: DedA family protein [unclassified Exiguobacterium]|uniref:DedA family protein n=1 Tax=unclassified Exiguobacterium TaxID=2644629 RepID=UPI0009401E47|nr:VTT domain-containing protein [Exiguobacterium sp. AT1b]